MEKIVKTLGSQTKGKLAMSLVNYILLSIKSRPAILQFCRSKKLEILLLVE